VGNPDLVIPYTILNCTFRIDRKRDDHGSLFSLAKKKTESYDFSLTVDDPKKYEDWLDKSLLEADWKTYEGYTKAWTFQEPLWQYIEKFDTFHVYEYTAYTSVTGSIIAELEHYKEHGDFPTTYRGFPDFIALKHLETLVNYWD
jgi:hypothetical protein